jgi:dTDP-4-dehydrorhamnose reductase
MKVLVLGAGGMAGHVIATFLAEKGYDVETVSANNRLNPHTTLLDVTRQDELHQYLAGTEFDVIVNCIGMLIKASDEQKDRAVYLNAYLPHLLEKHYEESKTKVIHLSTDCVFSGKHAPYTEDSWYDGALFYDRSKALGEINNNKDLTFRMSIIGPDMHRKGIGLFNWFFSQTGLISGYTKAIWNGITTIELARGIDAAIGQDLTGLYHLVPKNNISKYDLLQLFVAQFERSDITVQPVDGVLLDKTLVNTRKDFDFSVHSYPKMIDEMRLWIGQHPNLYPHYDK